MSPKSPCIPIKPRLGRYARNGSESGDDDTLTLLFMCCHESLTPSSAIALILRAVGGLTTQEIAKAFLVPEATMAQRISRAKSSIKASGAPFRLPNTQERPERMRVVLHVLYLIFNEGYVTSGGAHLQRLELAHEAIRLARMLHSSLPDDAEAAGLLALMLLTDARASRANRPRRRVDSDDETGSIPLGSRRDLRGRRPFSQQPSQRGRSATTSYRPPLQRFTTKRHGPKTRIGRRFWRSTIC